MAGLAPSPTAAPRRRSVASNAAFMLVAQAVTWGLNLLIAVALPRYLGPETVGELRIGISLWAIAQVVVTAGTGVYMTRQFARDGTADPLLIGRSVVLQYLLYVLSSIAIAVFVVVAGYPTDVVVLVAIVGLYVALQPFVGSAKAALQGLERMDQVSVVEVAQKVLFVTLILLVIAADAGVRAVAGTHAVVTAAGAGLFWFLLRRYGLSWRPRLEGAGTVFRHSRTFMATDIVLVLYQQVDIIVISLLVPQIALGWYSGADALFGSLLFLPMIVITALFPAFSRLHDSDPDEARSLLCQSFCLLLLVGVPVGLGTVAVADPIALLLYGEEFAGTGPVLAILGIVAIITFQTVLIGRYALATDRQAFWVRVMVVATLATVVLDLLLVPWTAGSFGNGAIGGAVAFVITELAMLIVGVRRLAPHLASRPVVVRAVKSFTAGFVMLAAVWPLRWHPIIVPIVVGAVVYTAVVLALRTLDTEEVAMVRAARQRLGSRFRAGPRADMGAD